MNILLFQMISALFLYLLMLCLQHTPLAHSSISSNNDTCNLTLVRNLCELDLLNRSTDSISEEVTRTAQCFAKEPELDLNVSHSETEDLDQAFACLAADIQRILKCSESVVAPDTHIMKLFFDGTLDDELNNTHLYRHGCMLCFTVQFYMILLKSMLAINYDTKICEFAGSQSLNITLWYQLTEEVQTFVYELNVMKQIRSYDNFKNVSTSPWFENFLDIETWRNYEFNVRTYIMSLMDDPESELGDNVMILILFLHGTLFLIGFIGNIILFLIFARHREMLSSNNVIILNLAIGDSFSLICNIIVSYMYTLSDSMIVGFLVCLSITLFIPLSTGICVYSVTMLSIQRYFALAHMGKARGCRILRRFSSALFICTIWVLACASAVPQFLKTEFYEDYCTVELTDFVTLFNVVVYCVIPLLLMATFSTATSWKMRQSVQKMPGEVLGQQKARSARTRSANILIGLIVVFAISYIPYYLFLFAYKYFNLEKIGFNQMFIISYSLIFVNSCCNPIALYAASGNFRQYFNRYLLWFCRFRLKCCRRKDDGETVSQATQKSSINSSSL